MTKSFFLALLSLFLLPACKHKQQSTDRIVETTELSTAIEIHGHRGDRGNYPENSLPAFLSAVRKGADVLELDVVISNDKEVVVSHEPFMHSLYMRTPNGKSISKEDEQQYNLYTMNYDSIKKFDSGSKGNRLFPQQKKQLTYKPLLREVIDSVESFVAKNNVQPLKYNIEIKSNRNQYGISQPQPDEFIDLVMEVIKEKNLPGGFNIQSFDVNILNLMKKKYPDVELAYLVSGESIPKNLAALDFKPEIYSPNFNLVTTEEFVDSIRTKKMKLIPWTVNDEEDIKKMIQLNVDGIITDYPERVQKLLE